MAHVTQQLVADRVVRRSEAECEAEPSRPSCPRLALRTITGLLRETRRTLRMNSGALWKPSMYVQICFTVGSFS